MRTQVSCSQATDDAECTAWLAELACYYAHDCKVDGIFKGLKASVKQNRCQDRFDVDDLDHCCMIHNFSSAPVLLQVDKHLQGKLTNLKGACHDCKTGCVMQVLTGRFWKHKRRKSGKGKESGTANGSGRCVLLYC